MTVSERDSTADARLAQLARTLDALPAGRVLATSTDSEDQTLALATLTLEVVQAVTGSIASRVDAAEWDHTDHLASRVLLKNLHTATSGLRWTANGAGRRLERAHEAIRDVQHFLAKDARLEEVRRHRRATAARLRSGDDGAGDREN